MKIVVCIRQGLDGDINPFDACAYEAALQVKDAEVILLSMGPSSVYDFLVKLTRLGASGAILLSDKAFAGADTLATAYTLSLAIEKLKPDYIFCGRQTLIGDTAQTGPMLSSLCGFNLATNVMEIKSIGSDITCLTRDEGQISLSAPALITAERINTLRLPSIRSKPSSVQVWGINDIGADSKKCGLEGSPTRVLSTAQNRSGRRKCTFLSIDEFEGIIDTALKQNVQKNAPSENSGKRLKNVCIVGSTPEKMARTVSDDITVLPLSNAREIIERINELKPNAVLFGSDAKSKRLAAIVAAKQNCGLCADCTALDTDGEQLIMYRPALSGSVIAKIISKTKPCFATVRTTDNNISDIMIGIGFGAKEKIEQIKAFAKERGAQISATRKMVDNDYLPYELQVGLTGKTVAPPVYIALGISGAVHHIVGMQSAGTVIAVNPDKNAPIFDYADYGILANIEDVIK